MGKTVSLLPNSSPAILQPMRNGLQVKWHEELDSHVLYMNEARIAAHHNGFSCHNLAERMLAGKVERAAEQFDYIKACGGTLYIERGEFLAIARAVQRFNEGDRVRYIGNALPAYRGEVGTVETECSPRPSNFYRVRFDNPIGDLCPFKGRKVHTGTVAAHALERAI